MREPTDSQPDLYGDLKGFHHFWEGDFTLPWMNYSGPGTDLSYNLQHNVKPVDQIDRIALEHDYNYTIHPNDQTRADIVALKKAFATKPNGILETINKDIMEVGLGLKQLLYNPIHDLFSSKNNDADKPDYLNREFTNIYGEQYDSNSWFDTRETSLF